MLTNVELYFIHGWGFDSTIWNRWLSFIGPNIVTNIFDRGYFKNRKTDFNLNISNQAKIIIAHSFGMHYLSAKDLRQTHMLILISGFCDFHEHAHNYRFSNKQIELMKQRLVLDPRGLLADFYSRCGLGNMTFSSPLINHQLLYDDLVILNKNKMDRDNLKSIPQILLLHGMEDRIVDQKHSERLHEQLANSKLFLHKNSGHALPLSDPQWCIEKIQAQMNRKIFNNVV